MEETKSEHPHTQYQHEHGHDRGPYWKRAHRDWKLWLAVLVMLGAMAVFLRTNDLSLRPNSSVPHQPVP